MKEYRHGTAVVIDINALIDNDAHLTFVEVVTDHIDHKIAGTADLYDLVSAERDGAAHFILSGHDIGLM